MTTNQMNVGRDFWLKWMLRTVEGYVLSLAAIFVISLAIKGVVVSVTGKAQTGIPSAAVLLSSVANFYVLRSVQSLVLRQYLVKSSLWIHASVVGSLLSLCTVSGITFIYGVDSPLIVYGIGVGIFQWLVFQTERSRAGWWVVWSMAAYLCAGEIGAFFATGFVKQAVITAVVSAIEGTGLVWFLRQPVGKSRSVRPDHWETGTAHSVDKNF